ncbi:MAG: GNAT family N-acetyltransferase [Acidobacteriota bacterium]
MTFAIREATPADAPGIRRLFARTFRADLPEAEWRWKFERNPDGWYGIVAEDGGEIVGNYAGWGMRFLLDGQETLLYSVGDVATDRRVRGLGRAVYRTMAGAFYESVGARGVPFCFGFPNARALAISHRLIGSRTLLPIREVRIPVASFPPPPVEACSGDYVDETFDPLWAAARGTIAWGAIRDRARANWRFHARPLRYYRMVWLSGPAGMTSWAALSVVGERALVADWLAAAGGAGLPELLAAAAAEAAVLGARELVLWETPGGPGREVISRLPGERVEAGFPLIVRSFDDDAANRFSEKAHLVPALYDLV